MLTLKLYFWSQAPVTPNCDVRSRDRTSGASRVLFRSHVVLECLSTFQLPRQEDSALTSTDNTETLDRPQRMSLALEVTSLACTDLDTVMELMDR